MDYRLPWLPNTHTTRTSKPLASEAATQYKQCNRETRTTMQRKVANMNVMEAVIEGSKADTVDQALNMICDSLGFNIKELAEKADVDFEGFGNDNKESWESEKPENKVMDLFKLTSVIVGALLPMAYVIDAMEEIRDNLESELGDTETNSVGVT